MRVGDGDRARPGEADPGAAEPGPAGSEDGAGAASRLPSRLSFVRIFRRKKGMALFHSSREIRLSCFRDNFAKKAFEEGKCGFREHAVTGAERQGQKGFKSLKFKSQTGRDCHVYAVKARVR